MDKKQMLNTWKTNQFLLRQYSDTEFQTAVERILRHRQSTLKFRASLSGAQNANFRGNYTLGRISHNYFKQCNFQGASLKSVAGAGSIFSYVKFQNTDLSNSTFQNSSFANCKFSSCDLSSCNLSRSYIENTTWSDCTLDGMNMTGTHLKGCSFLSTKPGNLTDATLEETYIENTRVTNLNLEFSTFDRLQTQDVVLAFSQMPYIFGGLEYLLHTQDQVRISSHINDQHSISIDEYFDVLKDMEVFYTHQQEYFPLANILMTFERYEEALAAILQGLQTAARQRDFRMCKYFCKLITQNGTFPPETLEALYQELCDKVAVHTLSGAQYYQYWTHMPEIRSMLVDNPDGYPHAVLRLQTDILDTGSSHVTLLLSALDDFLHLEGETLIRPSISVGHNSELLLTINLCGLPISILAVSALILSVVHKVCTTYNEVAEAIIKTQTIRSNHQKAKQMELENQKLQLEINRLETENTSLRHKVKTWTHEITDSGLVICHAEVVGQDFDPLKYL